MEKSLQAKILKIASEICWMHGSIAGDRVCQDWSGKKEIIESLTVDEKNELMKAYEEFNSNGEDYEKYYFPYDEMVISFVVAKAIENILVDEF